MGDYYLLPDTTKRPGNISGSSDDERFQCSAMNPFGQPKSNPSTPQIRADDGTSRTEAQYLNDQMKSEQDFGMAMYGPLIYGGKTLIGTNRMGAVLDAVDTLNRLRNGNLTEVAVDQLGSKVIEVTVDKLVEKIPILKGSESIIAEVAEDAIREGGGRLSDMWQARREAKEWSKEQDNIQRGIDRSEQRQRIRPGEEESVA